METEQSQNHEVKTYRTSKPPDQCVISYNFEHAHTNNFTHNLLIGLGFQSSPKSLRKGITSNPSQPNKQKLYSIISQPKTIFRNEAHSINKAYVGSTLPKRYMPQNSSKGNKKQLSNSEQTSSLHQQQLLTDKQNVTAPFEHAKLENFGKKKINSQYQNSISAESFRTPYGSLLPEGNGKSRYIVQNQKNHQTNQKRNQRKIYHNKSLQRRESQNENKKVFPHLSIRQNTQKEGNYNQTVNPKQNKKQFTSNNSKPQNASNKQKHHESLQLSRQINTQQHSNELLHHSLIEQQSDEQLTTQRQKHEKRQSQQLGKKNEARPQKQKISICNIQNNDIQVQQGSKKSINCQRSRKQIQDQQLQQLQDRVRKQNPHQIKKSHFKTVKNNEKEVFPFQAGIQPFFTNNKQSFSAQNIKTNPPYLKRPADNRQIRTSKIQSSHGNGEQKGNVNNRTHTSNATKPISRNTNSFSTNLLSPSNSNTVNHTIGQKENLKAEGIKKQKSHNLSSIISSNIIKRNSNQNNDQISKNKLKAQRQTRMNSKQKMEDITQNNQIKGFKVPEKNSSLSNPQKNKIQQNSSNKHRNTQQSITKHEETVNKNHQVSQNTSKNNNTNSKNETKQNLSKEIPSKQSRNNKMAEPNKQKKSPETSNKQRNSQIATSPTNRISDSKKNRNHSSIDKPQNQQSSLSKREQSESINKKGAVPKPTASHNPNDKDYKFKKWKESQLQQIQRQKRQLKIKNNSRNSLIVKKSPQSKDSKLKPKQNKVIDLDAQQQDKFGLFSKKTVKKSKTTKKAVPKKSKQQKISLTGAQGLENVEQERNQQEKSDSSEEINDSQSQSAQSEHKELREQESQTENIQEMRLGQQAKGQEMVDEFNERISSIHSSKISEKEIEPTQEKNNIHNGTQNRENLESLLLATEQINLKNHSPLTLDFNLQEGHQNIPNIKQSNGQTSFIQNMNQIDQNGEKQNISELVLKNVDKRVEQQNIEDSLIKKQDEHKMILQDSEKNQIIGPQLSPQMINKDKNQTGEKHQNSNQKQAGLIASGLVVNNQHIEATNTAQNNIFTSANRDDDFFEFNIKQISKINETINQTFNITKYQTIQKDIGLYSRAPIVSFMYQNNQKTQVQINSFVSSTRKLQLSKEEITSIKSSDQFVDNAISLLLSIDPWIIQRIFEPYLNVDQEVGVWLYINGNWKLSKVEYQGPTDSFKDILKKVIDNMLLISNLSKQMETVLRIISGVRVVKIKSTKKKILSELQYSLKKNHVLKALTSKDSKWGQRLFQVSGIETTKQGQNVLKIKSSNSDYFWVKQEKFKEIFQHFLLLCTRKSHFWTNKLIQKRENHKTVISIKSLEPSHGSITLFYPSQQKSSLFLYKEMQSRVLKFMGKIQQKANQNGNLYFEFKLHGSYYLFLETPTDCDLAIESSCKLMVGQPEYVISQTLKNQKCEYVQIERKQGAKGGKQAEKLQWLKEKFINMVSNKRQ